MAGREEQAALARTLIRGSMEQIGNGIDATASAFFGHVARTLLARHANEIPDLGHVVVLLPNYHAAQPLARHLALAADTPALLLPRMVTLGEWAQSVPLETAVVPDTCRATALYQALRARRWFSDADLWGITRELLSLLNEMTQHRITLPRDEQDFTAQLARAYRAKSNEPMQFEARVVHELWYAMNAGGAPDTARARQQRLAKLAERAHAPLYVLLSVALAAPEARFLDAYAQRAPVTVFDLRELVAQRDECAALRVLAPRQENAPTLCEQAATLRQHHPDAALNRRSADAGRTLRLFGAHGLEQEARAAEVQVRRWLLAGKKNIAIVALDRLVARRVRALLERAEVLVQDETGWILSTLSASTVLMRWLDALQSDFYHEDLLDLLKSPFIFADWPENERKQAVYQLERLVREHGVASGLDAYLDLAEGEAGIQTALARLRQAAQPLSRSSNSFYGWLCALDESLSILGVTQGLALDAAGAQLLQSLQTWQQELSSDNTRFSRAEWRHWLAQQLDADTFSDQSIDSPVLLTSLAATRLRSFDAVLLLGADAAHLPGASSGGVWFNDAVRKTLGLPTLAAHLAEQRDDLLGLLALNDTVLATWQASRNGEENLLSPFLEILRAQHTLAYGDDLAEPELGMWLAGAQVKPAPFPLPDTATAPAPRVPQSLLPRRISPGGYNSLVACPYQFYARHILRLNELDEVPEGVEKRDFGVWVHSILHRFHEQFPILGEHAPTALEEALRRISDSVFAPALERDYLAHAWLSRWRQAIPKYIGEQLESEATGWRYQSGETPFDLPLTDDLILHGRMDRVDVRAQESRVLDYKMIAANTLKNKLKEAGEDVQLACYAHACGAGEAAFISIEKDSVDAVAPPHDLAELAAANVARLLAVYGEMRAGAALPANGVEDACAHCEMRGLCRKSEWESSTL
jgi:ATP-dependent helicase/nuclease subunit B